MPVRVKKTDSKYRVSHGGTVSAKGTTEAKAERQANLLRAVAHGWEPTGEPARDKRKGKHHSAPMGSFWEKRSKL